MKKTSFCSTVVFS